MEGVKGAVWHKSNGANNTLEHDALWMLLTPVYCMLLFTISFFYVLYLFEGRENDESILNSDTGISTESALSLTLVCLLFFLIFKEKKLTCLFFFLNVKATKMYIFKKLWICSMMFARNKWEKSFID